MLAVNRLLATIRVRWNPGSSERVRREHVRREHVRRDVFIGNAFVGESRRTHPDESVPTNPFRRTRPDEPVPTNPYSDEPVLLDHLDLLASV